MGVPAAVARLALVCLPYAAALLGSGTIEEAQAVIPWVTGLGGQVCFHPNSPTLLLLVIATSVRLHCWAVRSPLALAAAQAHVKIGHNGAGVRATLALRSIKAGEVVIHVPANLTVTLATVREHSLAVRARTPVGKCFALLFSPVLLLLPAIFQVQHSC